MHNGNVTNPFEKEGVAQRRTFTPFSYLSPLIQKIFDFILPVPNLRFGKKGVGRKGEIRRLGK
jgi:hypothetical protein